MNIFAMPTPRLTAIPYLPDSSHWYRRIRHLPHPVWLDSGYPQSRYGRYDIIAAAPALLLETRADRTQIFQGSTMLAQSAANPFALLEEHLPVASPPALDLPFCGGAIGFFSYDLARRLEALPATSTQDIDLPEMRVGIYHWAIVQDHEQARAWLVELDNAEAPNEITAETVFHDLKKNIKSSDNSFSISRIESNLKAEEYANAFARIQAYLHAGDCYQVNFAQRFSADYEGDPFTAYLALRAALPSPFSAFMESDRQAILSLSPERFLRVNQAIAETEPIKGTIARGPDPVSDQRQAEVLQESLKDRAENLMIVDLLRNDLSKSCTDVQVPALFQLQSFANVHHLVSKICARLKPGVNPLRILQDCFPGGSITGAPKIRAMEIIEELEPTRRSIYCGSLGYISADGKMDTNIAIRTLACDGSRIHCWGGGGIVADSEVEKEYQESITKVKVLLETLTTRFGKSD
jgi:para-aminobenzoate synthetase component 1